MNTWNNIRAVYLLALSRLCAAVLWLMRQADRLRYIAPGDRLPRAAPATPSRDAAQACRSLDVTNWWCPDCGEICSSGKIHTCPTPKSAWGTKNAP